MGNVEGAKFCGNCGELLETKRIEKRKHKKKIKWGLVIFCVVLVTGCTVGGIFLAERVKKSNEYMEKIEKAELYEASGELEKAINLYSSAIQIMPERKEAYLELSRIYNEQTDFKQAMTLLDKGIEKVEQDEDLKAYIDEVEAEQEKWSLLSEIYEKMSEADYEWLNAFFCDSEDKAKLEEYGDKFYFQDFRIVDSIENGQGMIFDSYEGIYLGSIKDGERDGEGRQFGSEFSEDRYYTVSGNWVENSVNGYCTFYDNYYYESDDGSIWKATFSGNYTMGLEDGKIKMEWWTGEDEEQYDWGYIQSTAGVRECLEETEDGKLVYVEGDDRRWMSNDLTGRGVPIKKYDE